MRNEVVENGFPDYLSLLVKTKNAAELELAQAGTNKKKI